MGTRHRGSAWAIGALILSIFFGLAGCNAPEMSATPFYTGEHSRNQGPPEDRVNLWPVAYYHDPALSVLWPLMDWTDDHRAVRPFYSMYKLDKEEQDYNVLWPFSSFDFDAKQHHVFPCFWGGREGHAFFVLFPILWYMNGGSTHSFFPLYA